MYERSFSLENLLTIASFSSGIPSGAVYLVFPKFMAFMAASLMFCGVSKSGSPALKANMSLPCDFNSFASVDIDIVGDGFTSDKVSEINAINSSFIWLKIVLLVYCVEIITSRSKD